METKSDRPGTSSAEVHILFNGYANESTTSTVDRVASTVGFVRDGNVRVIIDPGMVPDPKSMLEPLAALGESPATITDVIFSHHHPDHTLNAALFPHARFHDFQAVYQDDVWLDREFSDGVSQLSPSVRLLLTPGHTPEDVSTVVVTADGLVVCTHLSWTA